MKIALVILHADPAKGGAERYTLDLANALVKRGHTVSMLASTFGDLQAGVEQVRINASGITRVGRYRSFLNSLDKAIAHEKYDVVHAMLPVRHCDIYHPHAGIAVESVNIGHRNKTGIIKRTASWIGNRTNARRLKYAVVESELLVRPNPPVVFCLSRLVQNTLLNVYPAFPVNHLEPLFNGIDLNRFNPTKETSIRSHYNISSAANVALFIAQDFERKGLKPAIEALSKMPTSDLVLLVAGKPDPVGYQNLADKLGVGKRVIFAGAITSPEAYYRSADFFVLPTSNDPCSLVVLEALAMGLPVITTTRNGASEVMQNGVHGFVLQFPIVISELSDAYAKLCKLSDRTKMAASCVNLRQALSFATHVDQVEFIYQKIEARQYKLLE